LPVNASENVLAVVEAKKSSRNARDADEQLRYYVTEIAKKQSFAPFGFMANGYDIWFWEVGQTNTRLVADFFAPSDPQLRQRPQKIENSDSNPANRL
jgi:type I restriction enzyme, R subunit